MGLFHFGRKADNAKDFGFDEIPVFSSLNPVEQKLIEKKVRLVEFKRGDIVYEEGTPSEAFYVVIAGRFRLFTRPKHAHDAEHTLLHFYRGDHFGEASLLTGQKHSGAVEAKQDGVILKIAKDDFLKLITEIPSLSLYLNRSLGHRLSFNADNEKRREVKIAALIAIDQEIMLFRHAADLAVRLHHETKGKVIVVDFSSLSPKTVADELQKGSVKEFSLFEWELSKEVLLKHVDSHSKGFGYIKINCDKADDREEKKIISLITLLTNHYSYILIRLPRTPDHPAFACLKKSDLVYLYSSADVAKLRESGQLFIQIQKAFGFSKNEIRVILTDKRSDKQILIDDFEKEVGARIFHYLVPADVSQVRYDGVVAFLAKELSGRLLGLSLGSGAAYGLSHIGVLKVLEREGIYPDVVAGSSIGALVGGFWAAGYSAADLEKIAYTIDKKDGFFKLVGFKDISLSHWGFFKGNQVSRFLEGYLGDKTFEDLRVPLIIPAVDLFTSEEIIFESGRLVDAIRASVSIPGIFRPFHYQKRHLMDGGVIDPLPIQTMTQMGVKKIIAVNVLLGPKDRVERTKIRSEAHSIWLKMMDTQGPMKRVFARTVDRMSSRYAVNIFNVIMNTIQFMEYEMAESWGRQADVLIHPIVPEAHWAEFYNPDKFIKAGEIKTQEHLNEIKRLIQEK